jgi:hypothetical protein
MRILISIIFITIFCQIFGEEKEKLVSYLPYFSPSYNKQDNREKIKQESQILSCYNASGSYDLTFFVSGTYLFFQPLQKGTIFGFSNNSLTESEISKAYDIDIKFKSGFKVSLGCMTSEDNWSFILNYFRFYSSKSKNIHQDAISTWAFTSSLELPLMSQIKTRWKLSLNILDLLLTRPFYSGTHVIIYPSIGLKGGKIEQNYYSNSLRQSDQTHFFSNNELESWMIGLTSNVKLKYIMINGFSVFANASASLLYQDFRVKNNQNFFLQNILTEDNWLNSISYINPCADISAGLEWGEYFSDNSLHLALLFGYEAQVYWNQNLINELKEYRRNYYMQEAGNLYLHGIIAQLRLDF